MATTETALVHLEQIKAIDLFKPEVIDPVLERIEAEARAEAARLDISTEENRKALASLAFKVARSKTFVDKQRLALVADQKRELKKIDAEGSRIWDRFESLQKEVRKPLTDWEEADKARIASHEQAISELEAVSQDADQNWLNRPAYFMRERLAEVESDNRDWQEFSSRGALAKKSAILHLSQAIEKRENYDREQVELVRLRAEAVERERQVREETIAENARQAEARRAEAEAARVQREAEEREVAIRRQHEEAEARAKAAEDALIAAEAKAAQDAKDAAEKAERDRVAAVAEADRRAKALVEQAERDRALQVEVQRRVETARENNQRHRIKVHREAKEAIEGVIRTQGGEGLVCGDMAQSIIAAIIDSHIPHVQVVY